MVKHFSLIYRHLFPLLLLLLLACGTGGGNRQSEDKDGVENNKVLYEKVMEIHDKMMPKMEDIYRLKLQLQQKIAESSDIVPETIESISSAINQLDSADKVMMDWMHEFKRPYDTVSIEQANAYLKVQMEKIEAVKKDMSQSIDRAKKKLENL